MRREARKNENKRNLNEMIIKYAGTGIAILAVIVLGLLIYSKNLNKEVKQGMLTGEQLSSIMNNTSSSNTQSASTEIGKSVNESKNEMSNSATNKVGNNNTENKSIDNKKTTNNGNDNNTSNNKTASNNKVDLNKAISNAESNVLTTKNVAPENSTAQTNADAKSSDTKNSDSKKDESVELKFEKPVEGDVVRDFSNENLIYSETLQEWTTHMGVDIKADKTTVVKAAEAGTVKSIKNDPRFGLTVIIEHANGYQTVYSNLLTSEFVVEGEKVEKGQSLGTVGNTAAFEIADEPHLHFEVLKDGAQINPNDVLGK